MSRKLILIALLVTIAYSMPPSPIYSVQEFVGKTVKEANHFNMVHEVMSPENKRVTSVREVSVDGEEMPVTMDFNEGRCNVATVEGKITEVRNMG